MEKRKSLSCSFPNQDPGLCSRSQTVNFSCQAAVFSCCVSDSLVTNEPFIPLRRSSLLFLPLVSAPLQLLTCQQHLCCGYYRHRNRDFSVNSLIGDTCAGSFSSLYLLCVSSSHLFLHAPSLFFLSASQGLWIVASRLRNEGFNQYLKVIGLRGSAPKPRDDMTG